MLSDMELEQLLSTYQDKYKTVVVDAFLLSPSSDSILLQKRSPNRRLFPNYWDSVGGHLEGSETIKEALAREVKEESSMELTEIRQLVHLFEWPEDPNVINFQFLCRAEGDFIPEKEKVTEVRWICASDLQSLEPFLTTSMREGLQKAFAALLKFN